MPLYEYACEKCGDRFEVMQKFSDEPLTTHEKCGGAVHRLISAPALQFKGSGWYVTDYARGGTSSPASDNGAATKSDASSNSGAGKTDASSSSSTTSTPSSSEAKPTTSPSK
jgi:putative FmdB family regulatory protein